MVLIERGTEVGGGNQRLARLNQVAQLPDGRYAATAIGTRRVVVQTWLPETPYPRAEVEELGDAHFDRGLDGPLLERAENEVRHEMARGEPQFLPSRLGNG